MWVDRATSCARSLKLLEVISSFEGHLSKALPPLLLLSLHLLTPAIGRLQQWGCSDTGSLAGRGL